jgi:GNAT superfamily N-acetyltransferase
VDLTVLPATLDRFADVAAILGPSAGSPHGCWCLYYRLSSAEFNRLQGEERPAHLRDLCAGEHAPGVLAYIDGEPVGWCALGPWEDMGRLQRSRTIPKVDERPRWSIVCFVVRAGHRRKGVARSLLSGAVDYATAAGVGLLEAYPVDAEGERISSAFAYVGTTTMFVDAGFRRTSATSSRTGGRPRWVMRLELPRS